MGLVISDDRNNRTLRISPYIIGAGDFSLSLFTKPSSADCFIYRFSEAMQFGFSNTYIEIGDISEMDGQTWFTFKFHGQDGISFNYNAMKNLMALARGLTAAQIQKLINYAKS